MSNVYTKDLSNEIYFLNDKNVVQEIDISEEVINPIASHQLVKNISDDVASYIEKTDKNIETISSDISSLQKKDEEIINNIDEVKSELISNIISTANALSTYSDEKLSTISSQIDTKIDDISSKVAVAYRPMGSVDSYQVLEEKLAKYLSLSNEVPMSSHIGEVWNVNGEVSSASGVKESGSNFVLVFSDSVDKYIWDDIGGIVDLSEYALSADVSYLVLAQTKQLSNYVNDVSKDLSTSVTDQLTNIVKDISSDLNTKIEDVQSTVGSLSITVSSDIYKLSNELNSKIHANTDLIGNTKTNILSTITNIDNKLTSADTYISGEIDNILTATIPSINGNITTISNDVQEITSTSIPNINKNISNISTDVGTLSTNVDVALEQVLKTVEFVGHITFSSPDDARKTASTLSDLIYKFNIPEKNKIKNGAMYRIDFILSSDKPANELAEYYVDVKIDENNSVRISHGDYIIFHDHETKQFIDISSITKENIYVTEVSFSDLYSLSTTVSAKIEDLSNTVSRDYAYLSGNNISNSHVLSGVHDFIGTINVANLLAENISADILSAETLSAVNLTAEDGVILTAEIDEATILSANISNLTAGIADIKTLYNDYISVENSLSASYIETPSAHISNEVVSNLTGTNVVITNLTGTNISARERLSAERIDAPIAYISYEQLLSADISNSLSVNFGNVYDKDKGQSLSTQLDNLSTAIDNKIYIGIHDGNELSTISSDLSVIKLTNKQYADLLNADKVLSNSIYIIEDTYIDAYGQIISNATNSDNIINKILTSYAHTSAISSNLTGYSEAATVKLVSALTIGKVGDLSDSLSSSVNAISDSLSTTVNSISSKLSSAISSKIYIQDPTVSELSDGAYDVNLSVIKLTPNDYITALTSNAICSQTLYVLCADYVDAFGQVISNAVNTSAAYNDSLSGYINDNELTTISKRGSFRESEVATVEFVNTIVQSRITNSYNKIYKALSVL